MDADEIELLIVGARVDNNPSILVVADDQLPWLFGVLLCPGIFKGSFSADKKSVGALAASKGLDVAARYCTSGSGMDSVGANHGMSLEYISGIKRHRRRLRVNVDNARRCQYLGRNTMVFQVSGCCCLLHEPFMKVNTMAEEPFVLK